MEGSTAGFLGVANVNRAPSQALAWDKQQNVLSPAMPDVHRGHSSFQMHQTAEAQMQSTVLLCATDVI